MVHKKILMLVGDYVEDHEAMVPFPMPMSMKTWLLLQPGLPILNG